MLESENWKVSQTSMLHPDYIVFYSFAETFFTD